MHVIVDYTFWLGEKCQILDKNKTYIEQQIANKSVWKCVSDTKSETETEVSISGATRVK